MGLVETFCLTGLFAAVFIFGEKLFTGSRTHPRRVLSLAGGAAVAYVFVHLLPELARASETFVGLTTAQTLPWPEYRVYAAALTGFVLFYGLEHMVHWSRHAGPRERSGEDARDPILVLHIGGFALYAGLISYLMVRGIDERAVPVLLYGIAMGLHFLSTGHSLHREHGRMYDVCGRWALALAVLAGWVCGVLVELPKQITITLLGLVSGGVVMNSTIAELPGEKDGRFIPFGIGAVAYAGLLLLL
jgi:hypothetical protein